MTHFHRFLQCVLVSYASLVIAAPAFASPATFQARLDACVGAANQEAFNACLAAAADDCLKGSLDLAKDACQDALDDALPSLNIGFAKAQVQAAPAPAPTVTQTPAPTPAPVAQKPADPPPAPEAPATTPIAVRVAAHPMAATVFAYPPVAEWSTCGDCVEIRETQAHKGVYVFWINGNPEPATVKYEDQGAGYRFSWQRPTDVDGNHVADDPPVDLVLSSTGTLYLVGHPGGEITVRWVHYVSDPTDPTAPYEPDGLTRGPKTIKLGGDSPHLYTIDF